MTDRQAFEAMAKKWPEKYWATESVTGAGSWWDFGAEDIGGWDNVGNLPTSDDYQALAGEMGYVIEPTHLRKSKWNCEISTDGDESHWLWQSGEDYDAFPTMLQAMQAGFHKVVELATKEDK